MTQWKLALACAALGGMVMLSVACLPGGSNPGPTPTATARTDVQAARSGTLSTATPAASPSATPLPVLPVLTTYVVKSGDYPMLIAENVGVPADQQDAWIAEMLALNGVEATSLQIDQELILPPFGDGAPVVTTTNQSSEAAPPAADVEPADTPSLASPTPQSSPPSAGIPFAPTPPFVAFTAPTATPTPTRTATATSTPSATPTIAAGARAWLTSSEDSAIYYYCDLDAGWHTIPTEKLLAFDSEQQLLAIWGRFRVKVPNSVC